MSIVAIHEELAFATHESALRTEQGVWRTLQLLRAKAEKDPRVESQYRAILTKTIAKLKSNQDDQLVTPETIETACAAFLAWYDQTKNASGIPEREALRGSLFEPWCEKWLPEPWAEYVAAFNAVMNAPSGENFERLRGTVTALVKAYLD